MHFLSSVQQCPKYVSQLLIEINGDPVLWCETHASTTYIRDPVSQVSRHYSVSRSKAGGVQRSTVSAAALGPVSFCSSESNLLRQDTMSSVMRSALSQLLAVDLDNYRGQTADQAFDCSSGFA
jgi:hypothetical protein